jgi:plasmid replication initiation protein
MNIKKAKLDADAPLNEQSVNMSNSLVRAAHGLTLSEKRVVSSCVAKLDSLRVDNGRYKVKLTAKEFAEAFEIDTDTAYTQLKTTGNHLMKRFTHFVEKTARGNIEHKWVWVSGVKYHHGEGWVELGFSHEITPHLILLRGEFTSYKLKQASALRSFYTWRLFELMMQFKSTGLLRISIDDFCHAIEAPKSYKKDFRNLRIRAIEPSVAELKDKNNMLIEWKGTKTGGRKITGLEFRFKENPQKSLQYDCL